MEFYILYVIGLCCGCALGFILMNKFADKIFCFFGLHYWQRIRWQRRCMDCKKTQILIRDEWENVKS